MDIVEKVVTQQLNNLVSESRKKLIRDQALLKEDLALDSLRLITLFTNSIQVLNIDISAFEDSELFNIHTVEGLKRTLRSKKKSI